jgi:hypothetical protein
LLNFAGKNVFGESTQLSNMLGTGAEQVIKEKELIGIYLCDI